MPREVNLERMPDITEVVRAATAALSVGEVVVLPDDCGWRLLALSTDERGARALQELANTHPENRASIEIADPSMAEDYVDALPKLYQKLSSRCWPSPVHLRMGGGLPEGLSVRWPGDAREWGLTANGRAFSLAGDSLGTELARRLPGPLLSLVIGSDRDPGTLPVSLILRADVQRYAELPTVVSIQGERCRIDQPGVVSDRMLKRLAGDIILFVCTGNTCRSPMAEGLFRKMLGERLECSDDELLDRGFTVISAGLSAYPGAPAAREAVELLQAEGIDLSGHESQPVTEELLSVCDYILTMTQGHMDAILAASPELKDRVRMLSPRSRDISDPIGGGPQEYARCRDEIAGYLREFIDALKISE